MANRKIHTLVGAVSGGTYAFFTSLDQEPFDQFLETVGGGFGGAGGGRLPDIIEPALNPRHRSVAHAIVPAVAIGAKVVPIFLSGKQQLRQCADGCRARRDDATGFFEKIFLWLAEKCLRLVCGAMAGLASGYASHLVLDAFTPMGLPLIS